MPGELLWERVGNPPPPETNQPGRSRARGKRVACNSRCWWRDSAGGLQRVLTIALLWQTRCTPILM